MGFWKQIFGIETDMPGTGVENGKIRASGEAGDFYNINDPRIIDFLRNGGATSTGRHVNERSALRNPTFNRAVTLVSQVVGMLPLNLMVREGNGDKNKAVGHPAHDLLRPRGKPNSYQDPFKFKSYMQGRALLYGNAFAYKVPGVRGVQALVPMDPRCVEVKLSDSYQLQYIWQPENSARKVLGDGEVFHLRSPWSSDGVNGVGLIESVAEALGLAEAADEAAGRLLRNGAYVGGVLRHPKTLSAAAAQKLREQFETGHAGPENAGRWMVLEEDMDARPFGMSGRDAQGLENRRYQAEEVSRATGVPRPLLMFDETSWGTGIEQLGLFLVTYCLSGWFTAWEEALARSLLSHADRENHYFKFNEAALMRGSLKDQAEFLSKAIGGPGQGGYLVPNDVREIMDYNKADHPAMNRPAWAPVETVDAA